VDVSEVLTECLVGPTDHRLKTSLVRTPLWPLELLVLPSTPGPWADGGGEIEASTRCYKELSACCEAVVLRMLFNRW
jgi:hypothetical protein